MVRRFALIPKRGTRGFGSGNLWRAWWDSQELPCIYDHLCLCHLPPVGVHHRADGLFNIVKGCKRIQLLEYLVLHTSACQSLCFFQLFLFPPRLNLKSFCIPNSERKWDPYWILLGSLSDCVLCSFSFCFHVLNSGTKR